MLLAKTRLPIEFVNALAAFNIIYVEQFLSIAQSRRLITNITLALDISVEELQRWIEVLKTDYPKFEAPPAHGKIYHMGYKVSRS